jgi:hypothetical protein
MFSDFLTQTGYGVKTLEEAGKYIYSGLTQEHKEHLADLFMEKIESIFQSLHRDYAEMVFK